MKTFLGIDQASKQMKSFMGLPDKRPKKRVEPKTWLKFGGIGLTAVVAIFGLCFGMQQIGWSPQVLWATVFPDAGSKNLFNGGAGVSQLEARQMYHEAMVDLKQKKDYATALSAFQFLEKAYPGLADLVLLHQAEAYIGLGAERQAQERLQLVMAKFPTSPIHHYARYQLAQSYFRGQQNHLARQAFDVLAKGDPESDYTVASLYYLGWLKAEEHHKAGEPLNIEGAAPYWLKYLEKSSDGRFAPELAKELDKAIAVKSPQQAQWLGLGYATGEEDWEKVKTLLAQAPLSQVWYELGQAQMKTGEIPKGVATLVKGLPTETERQRAKDGIDMLIRNSAHPAIDLTKVYDASGEAPMVAGDYLLWRLSQIDTARASQYYQVLLRHYPDKDYAPESSWNLMWPLLQANQEQAFLSRAKVHLERYPQSKSAAKVLFWQAKIAERHQQTQNAAALYHAIIKRAPNSYYAFRTYGRLLALEKHQPDPGWKTQLQGASYPPSEAAQQNSVIHPGLKSFLSEHPLHRGIHEGRFLAVAQEIEAAQSASDLVLWFNEGTGDVPASVQSWSEALSGDVAQSIRTIRDDLDDRYKNGYQPSPEELKMLYPNYHLPSIALEAGRNNIDPYLVQSLMREESYFNPLAVSSSDARGLMQLLPTTAQEVAKQAKVPGYTTMSLFAPEVNIQLGSRYLGYLHKTFQGQSMPSVGAYNGGPNAMKRWMQGANGSQGDADFFVESIPYEQTRDYIKKVFTGYWNYNRLYQPTHPFRQAS